MNIENLNKAIAVMERAKERDSLFMLHWQSTNHKLIYGAAANSEEELHACGNKACFAGHIAVSPEWCADKNNWSTPGGGVPVRFNETLFKAEEAVADWLDIPNKLADYFIHNYTGLYQSYTDDDADHILYGVPWISVKAEHVIRELTLLRDMGEDEYLKLKESQYELRQPKQGHRSDGKGEGT